MRILTVRQPWAWAILAAGKDVENRGRNVAGSYRGLVAIHAGLREDYAADYFDPANDAMQAWQDAHGPVELGDRPWDPRGVIIGVVDLVDVHGVIETGGRFHCEPVAAPTDFAVSGACSRWAEKGAQHLVLANPRPLVEPIPYQGALGMRTLSDDVAQRVFAGVAS